MFYLGITNINGKDKRVMVDKVDIESEYGERVVRKIRFLADTPEYHWIEFDEKKHTYIGPVFLVITGVTIPHAYIPRHTYLPDDDC